MKFEEFSDCIKALCTSGYDNLAWETGWVTVANAAAITKKTGDTIRKYIHSGNLVYKKDPIMVIKIGSLYDLAIEKGWI